MLREGKLFGRRKRPFWKLKPTHAEHLPHFPDKVRKAEKAALSHAGAAPGSGPVPPSNPSHTHLELHKHRHHVGTTPDLSRFSRFLTMSASVQSFQLPKVMPAPISYGQGLQCGWSGSTPTAAPHHISGWCCVPVHFILKTQQQ